VALVLVILGVLPMSGWGLATKAHEHQDEVHG